MRTPADDDNPAVIVAEQLAYGLAGLDCPIFESPVLRWMGLEPKERALYMAKARFVLGLAEDAPRQEPAGGDWSGAW